MLSETLGLGGVGIDEKDFPLVSKAEEVAPSERPGRRFGQNRYRQPLSPCRGWIEKDKLIT